MNLIDIEVSNNVIIIEDDSIETLSGLNKESLINALKSIRLSTKKKNISKVGILIDQDNFTKTEKLTFVNAAIAESFGEENILSNTCVFSTVSVDDKQSLDIAMFLTNVNGCGELETILKEIKSQSSIHADCLENWWNCLKMSGNDLSRKEFDKFWIQFYVRYDTCTAREQTQAGKYCTIEASMKKSIWNFDHECLNELKQFLKLFGTETI